MKLGIMQPYFFPYIGYWQLIYAVDRFVIYDDVNYIKGGWVNRNRLLINGGPSYITLPLDHSSPNMRICDISLESAPRWRDKMIKTIENTYRRAPFFSQVFPVISDLINDRSDNLAQYLANHICVLSKFMGIDTALVMSSRYYGNGDLSGQSRVIDICKREDAQTYINAQGGQSLYNLQAFRDRGVDLCFLAMRPLPYKQRKAGFVPYLSIVDALMEVGPVEMKNHLEAFELITGKNVHAF